MLLVAKSFSSHNAAASLGGVALSVAPPSVYTGQPIPIRLAGDQSRRSAGPQDESLSPSAWLLE